MVPNRVGFNRSPCYRCCGGPTCRVGPVPVMFARYLRVTTGIVSICWPRLKSNEGAYTLSVFVSVFGCSVLSRPPLARRAPVNRKNKKSKNLRKYCRMACGYANPLSWLMDPQCGFSSHMLRPGPLRLPNPTANTARQTAKVTFLFSSTGNMDSDGK